MKGGVYRMLTMKEWPVFMDFRIQKKPSLRDGFGGGTHIYCAIRSFTLFMASFRLLFMTRA